MIKFLMVDVESITSGIPRSNFSETVLEELADKILESGGILSPLLLKKIGSNQYEVIDRHLEYYAAVRAKEKNSDQGEMVNALIIPPETEDVVLKQVEALRKVETTNTSTSIPTERTNNDSGLTNLELRIEKRINDLKAEQARDRQKFEDELRDIKKQIPSKTTPLDVFNDFKLSELAFRLKSAGLSENAAIKIAESVEKERQQKRFESLSDVVTRVKIASGKKQIKGMSGDKMVSIIDSWSRTLFI